ncbi:MAG: signal peptidase I [Chloroflexota bacterium]|nr:signal peptidase I [Chloroflexota bacterium]
MIDSSPRSAVIARPRLQRSRLIVEVFDTVLLIALVYTLVNLATVRFFIEGASMQPSFYEGQNLIVSRVHYLLGDPQRGDVVVLDPPGDDDGENPLLLKRLIGLPGETVSLRDGQLYIDDALRVEPYIKEACTRSTCQDSTWEIPPGSYFFMGDNRNNSRDSRAFGVVTRDRIIGEVVVRYWPLSEVGIVIRHRFSEAP